MVEPRIALIGGASGTGKTSSARLLANEFGFHHTLGTGFAREICKHYIKFEDNKYLHAFSFDDTLDKSGYQLLLEQSLELYHPIKMCVNRAKREGTSLAIEGVNIMPELYDSLSVDLKIILINKKRENHGLMCRSESHSKRLVTEENLDNSRIIQNSLINSALKYNWPTMECTQFRDYLIEGDF